MKQQIEELIKEAEERIIEFDDDLKKSWPDEDPRARLIDLLTGCEDFLSLLNEIAKQNI